MLKPLHSFFNLGATKQQPPTFGQKRADQLEERFTKAVKDRQKMYHAEHAADKPLDEAYRQKGELLGNKIDRLQKERSDTNE